MIHYLAFELVYWVIRFYNGSWIKSMHFIQINEHHRYNVHSGTKNIKIFTACYFYSWFHLNNTSLILCVMVKLKKPTIYASMAIFKNLFYRKPSHLNLFMKQLILKCNIVWRLAWLLLKVIGIQSFPFIPRFITKWPTKLIWNIKQSKFHAGPLI